MRKHNKSLKYIETKTRKTESLFQKKTFLIACEGLCTEPNYIKNLVNYQKKEKIIAQGTTVIIAQHQHSGPKGVVSDLMATLN